MADAKTQGKRYCCLICHISFSTEIKVGKVDALFLLRILLEIPQDSELVKSLDFVQVCEQCGNVIKQCKLTYGKICEEIERFWECQNKILEGFSKLTTKDDDDRDTVSEKDRWANQCRNFVKNHDFAGFGYPFVVHDLESFVTFTPPKISNQVNCTFKHELSIITAEENNEDCSSPILEVPLPPPHSSEDIRNFASTSSTDQAEVQVKEELESELDDNSIDNDEANDMSKFSDDDDDNDSEYEPSPSKRPKNVQNYNLRTSPPRKSKPDKEISEEGDARQRKSFRKGPRPKSAVSQVPPSQAEKALDEDNFERDPKTKKFHCTWPECTKQFVERKSIIWHMDKHKGTPRRECDQCDLKFFSMPQLRRHQELEHGNGMKFECKTCGEDFPCRAKLNQHWTTKHSTNTTFNKPVICEICGKSVRLSNLEQQVKRLHSGGIQKRFCCHLCPNIFEKEVRLKMHLWRIHEICEDEDVKERLIKISERRRELGTKGTRWKCRVKGCVLWFATQEGWRSHVDNRHGGKEGDGEEGRFKCEICGKGFHKNNVFKAHLEAHDRQMGKRERNWICVICGWSHETERKLNGHMDKVHKGEELKPRPFKCDQCTKRFGTKVHLNYHKRHVHKLTKE